MADLKRTLFGYSSASVRSALTERDASLDHASKNARAACPASAPLWRA